MNPDVDGAVRLVVRDLINRHYKAARDGDEALQAQVLDLIDGVEAVYPYSVGAVVGFKAEAA
jgi:hypothetical protein